MRKKKKKITIKYSRGKPIDPILLKARALRKSLLVRNPEYKETTPLIKVLHAWLTIPSYICYYCLKSLELEDITVDHKTPICRKGSNDITNLAISCMSCNNMISKFTEIEFRSLLELIKNWDIEAQQSLLQRLKASNNIFRK